MARQTCSTRYSIVSYHSSAKDVKCGYCGKSNAVTTHGMLSFRLWARDYQALLDRGWRRCGCYIYKPCLSEICCPTYTIKCDALNFKITKSQKKIIKRMGKFLRNELRKDEMIVDSNEGERGDNIAVDDMLNFNKHIQKMEETTAEIDDKVIQDSSLQPPEEQERKPDASKKSDSMPCKAVLNKESPTASRSVESVEMKTARGPCKKAKLMRIERKKNKLLAQGKTQEEIDAIFDKKNKPENKEKSLEELFDEMYAGTNNRLEIKMIRINSGNLPDAFDATLNVFKKYQMIIHSEPEEECEKEHFVYCFVRHPMKFDVARASENEPPCGYGSFHQQYWLDNKLIAVGVIDILPFCVSSVYFFYDPDYSFLSLGTFSSLREVLLTRQLYKSAKDLRYYYMGYYIHSCPKMRYKARMKPSKLLCPETYKWFDIEPCLKKLDKTKYSRFNEDLDAIDQDGIVDINKVLIIYQETAMPYRICKAQYKRDIDEDEENKLKEYASLIGMSCAQRMLLLYPMT